MRSEPNSGFATQPSWSDQSSRFACFIVPSGRETPRRLIPGEGLELLPCPHGGGHHESNCRCTRRFLRAVRSERHRQSDRRSSAPTTPVLGQGTAFAHPIGLLRRHRWHPRSTGLPWLAPQKGSWWPNPAMARLGQPGRRCCVVGDVDKITRHSQFGSRHRVAVHLRNHRFGKIQIENQPSVAGEPTPRHRGRNSRASSMSGDDRS